MHKKKFLHDSQIRVPVSILGENEVDLSGRLRQSEPLTLVDGKQVGDKNPYVYSEETVGLGASCTYFPSDSATLMEVSSDGEYAIRQTKVRLIYEPDKPAYCLQTFSDIGIESQVIKRVGYFNSNSGQALPWTSAIEDYDGIYFESNGDDDEYYFVIEKSGTTIAKVPRDRWLDPLDGTGVSGYSIDLNGINFMMIELLWLGGGGVRISFRHECQWITVFQQEFAGESEYNSAYLTSPHHSARWEIVSTGGAGAFKHCCGSLGTDGGKLGPIGRPAAKAGTSATISTGVFWGGLAIRAKEDFLFANIKPTFAGVVSANTTGKFTWHLLINPDISSGPLNDLSYTSVDAHSAFEYSQMGTGVTITDPGMAIMIGGASSETDLSNTFLDAALTLGVSIDGERDVLVLAAKNEGSGSKTLIPVLSWKEYR